MGTAFLEEASFPPKSVPDLMFSIKAVFGVHALFLRKKEFGVGCVGNSWSFQARQALIAAPSWGQVRNKAAESRHFRCTSLAAKQLTKR